MDFASQPGQPQSALSRRRLLGSAAALGLSSTGLASLLAACGGQQRTPQTEAGQQAQQQPGQVQGGQYPEDAAKALNDSLKWPQTLVPEPSSPVTITVAHAWESAFLPRQKQFDKFFTERHPNIKVTIENTAWPEFQKKYVTAAAGGNLPDLMYMHFSWIQVFIRQGVFINLSDYLAKQTDFKLEDFTKPSTIPFKSGDSLYGIPYDCGPLMLFYNKDMLAKYGVEEPTDSWTLDDVKKGALKVAEGGGGKIWGLAGGPSPTSSDLAPPWLFPFGARFVNETQTACVINEPKAVETMRYWHELREKKAIPTPAQAAAVLPDAFVVGRAGFQLNGTWATPSLQSLAKFKWSMAKWPKGPVTQSTSAEGSAYAITTKSKNADAAWIYLNEYISEAGQNFMWASTGRGSPSRSSAWRYYTESELAAPNADQILPTLNEIGSADILYLPQTTKAMDTASPLWDRVLAGKLSLEDGLNQIASALTPILAGNAQ
jgi:multiple sugar transport system substrate-binding protein